MIFQNQVTARGNKLWSPLPIPSLDEQLEAGQIFPDNPAYYKVSF
ncbi:MAG: hypothetical protein ACRCXC_07120 [Legionella sp.]